MLNGYAYTMRITIRLEDSLLREAKRQAAEQGTTLAAVIENAAQRGKASFTTSGMGGLRPGVDLEGSAALLEVMEQHS